jgi:hypothetical protein
MLSQDMPQHSTTITPTAQQHAQSRYASNKAAPSTSLQKPHTPAEKTTRQKDTKPTPKRRQHFHLKLNPPFRNNKT